MTSQVDLKIEQWKRRLLDLSRRNRLLFFRPTKYSTIRITSPGLRPLFDQLVNDEKRLRFPLPVVPAGEQLPLTEEEDKSLPQFRLRKGDLEVDVGPADMMRRLYRLRRDYRSSIVEQGVHTLFLALGMLRWRETPDGDDALAPVVLVPVTLERDSDGKPYELALADEEVTVNPTLAFKLEHDFRISLPQWPEEPTGEDLLAYLRQVHHLVQGRGWSLREEAWLGRFSFEKLVIYKDLQEHREAAIAHPIVRALAGQAPATEPTDPGDESDLDELATQPEVFPVLPADSSQTQVLVQARHGHNLVVYGPPGTGKSQTIANLIAQFLRDGKRVLFVSEKMAALEVVDKRLRDKGLGPAILEVHSHRANKRAVIEELGRTLLAEKGPIQPTPESEFQRLRQLVKDLNAYVRELHVQRDPQGRSAYRVIGQLAQLRHVPYLDAPLPWDSPLSVPAQEEMEAESALRELAAMNEVVARYHDHPFRGWHVQELSLEERYRIGTLLRNLAGLAAAADSETRILVENLGLKPPTSLAELRSVAGAARILVEAAPVPSFWLGHWEAGSARVLTVAPETWISRGGRGRPNFPYLRDMLRQARERQERHNHDRAALENLCGVDIAELPVEELRERFRTRYSGLLRFLNSSYRRDMRLLGTVWRGPARLRYETALRALDLASSFREGQRWLEQALPVLSYVLGDGLFAGLQTDWENAEAALNWAERLYQHFDGNVPAELAAKLRRPDEVSQAASKALEVLTKHLDDLEKGLQELQRYCSEATVLGLPLEAATLTDLSRWCSERAERLEELDEWARFQRAYLRCSRLGLGPLVDLALHQRLPASDFLAAFQKRFLTAWLSAARRESPVLAQFSGAHREELIRSFRELDERLLGVAARLTLAQVRQRQPKAVASFGGGGSQMGILLREINKKRRHKPLRVLFSEIPQLLQALKPCLLMSPLSVSSYLPKDKFHFDVVIFDEASQMPPEDAICSILRADQVIVAGDDKQLPPTRFFQVDLDAEDEDEAASEDEVLDSILEECASIPWFTRCRLRWHYRSRQEGLIAFSNREFYEGELITFPGPQVEDQSVRFVHVPDGVYDRGRSRTNRVEARKVAQLVIEHFEQWRHSRSLGVIALGIAQERAIDEELRRLRVSRPDLAPFFAEEGDEPFFVKNLENVQGDERDHIIISTGYGPDASGNMTLNFGPINRAGGERRLNVAITRARWQTTVVCSFLPEQLDLARLTTNNQGVIKLQRCLEYARTGRFMAEAAGIGSPESEFEEAVRAALEREGLKVDSQVGCSGFRIDLAVRHPDREGRYILGIECDGAQYHSARTARDRDRLRQQVLEALGWNLIRIWCPDWLSNPEGQLRRVLAKIEELRKRGDPGIAAPPPTQSTQDGPLNGGAADGRDGRKEEEPSSVPPSQPESLDLPPYVEYAPTHPRPSDELYRALSSDAALGSVIAELVRIVDVEAPVHKDAVIRRLARAYGLKRTGGTIRMIAERAILRAEAQSLIRVRGEFLWWADDRPVTPRRRKDGEEPPIEEISLEEIAAAMQMALKAHFGMDAATLITESSRMLGYDRTGERVRKRMTEALNMLLASGWASVQDGVIVEARHGDDAA